MLTFRNIANDPMTLAKTGPETLSQEEWNELVALKDAINQNPAAVHPDKMELFTKLLVKSWDAKCEPTNTSVWRTGHPLEE